VRKLIASRPFRVIAGLIRQYFEDGVARSSAELAYYLLFSIFPLLIVVNNLISRLELDAELVFQRFGLVLPAEVVGLFTDYLAYISGQDSGLLLWSGLFLTVYMVARAMRSLMRSVTRAYQLERRGVVFVITSFGLSLLLIMGIPVFLVLMVASGALQDLVGQYIDLSPQFVGLLHALGYFVGPVVLFVLLAAFYDLVGGKSYSFRMALPGAGFFVVIWTVATLLFSYYVANMANYSLLYGSIGAIMILMLWLYLTAILLILGGAFNRVLAQERRASDKQ